MLRRRRRPGIFVFCRRREPLCGNERRWPCIATSTGWAGNGPSPATASRRAIRSRRANSISRPAGYGKTACWKPCARKWLNIEDFDQGARGCAQVLSGAARKGRAASREGRPACGRRFGPERNSVEATGFGRGGFEPTGLERKPRRAAETAGSNIRHAGRGLAGKIRATNGAIRIEAITGVGGRCEGQIAFESQYRGSSSGSFTLTGSSFSK